MDPVYKQKETEMTPPPAQTAGQAPPADTYPRRPSDVFSATTFYGGPANQVIQKQTLSPANSDSNHVSAADGASGISQPSFNPPSREQLPELHAFHLLKGSMNTTDSGVRAVIGRVARCALGVCPSTGVALGTALGLVGAVRIGRAIIGASESIARAIRVALKDL